MPADVVLRTSTIVAITPGEEQKEKQRFRMRFCLFVGILLVFGAVLTSVLLTGQKRSIHTVYRPSCIVSVLCAIGRSVRCAVDCAYHWKLSLSPQLASSKVRNGEFYNLVFLNPNSPQYQAARWLSSEDAYALDWQNESKLLQRFSLATFYFSLGGNGWYICSQGDKMCGLGTGKQSWLSTSDDWEWVAVKCDGDGLATETFFDTRNIVGYVDTPYGLTGALPKEPRFVSRLATLALEKNFIYGSIPTWSGLSSLQVVRLPFNQISRTLPADFLSQNTMLQTLYLYANKLHGTIPWEQFSASVTELQIQNNQFSGLLSTAAGTLTNLSKFRAGALETFLSTISFVSHAASSSCNDATESSMWRATCWVDPYQQKVSSFQPLRNCVSVATKL